MDLPLLLGTVFTENRSRANAIGYVVHLANGLVFALVYAGIFAAVGRDGWLFGLALGAVHATFVGGGLVNIFLPAVHPRMGTPWTDAEETPLLEPPGFMLRNYGPAHRGGHVRAASRIRRDRGRIRGGSVSDEPPASSRR